MKTLIIIIAAAVIIFILKACIPTSNNGHNDTTRPTNLLTPPTIKNDKIVVIKGANYTDIRKAINQFCNIYNKADYAAIPNLTKVSEVEFAITFPHDITFTKFCFFVNYMYYPENIFYKADIKAWATTKQGDDWITEKSANKKVMLYIPSDDKDYDNVYLTTQDNIGYKLGFAAGEEKQLLDKPREKYVEQTLTLDNIKDYPTEEMK